MSVNSLAKVIWRQSVEVHRMLLAKMSYKTPNIGIRFRTIILTTWNRVRKYSCLFVVIQMISQISNRINFYFPETHTAVQHFSDTSGVNENLRRDNRFYSYNTLSCLLCFPFLLFPSLLLYPQRRQRLIFSYHSHLFFLPLHSLSMAFQIFSRWSRRPPSANAASSSNYCAKLFSRKHGI